MTATQEPRNDIYSGWDVGESGWAAQMDSNLIRLATLIGLSVIDRDLTAPPGSPADGDMYIPAATATGDWAGRENQLAIWNANATPAAWQFINPALTRSRLLVIIEDENRLGVWNGTNWNLGVALT